MNITCFFENETKEDFSLTRDCLFNGSLNIWDEMPFFEILSKELYVHDSIVIEFSSLDEAKEFSKFIDFDIDWDNNVWPNIGKWYPPKNRRRNTKLRFMHRETALANPDLYEIVPLTEIVP